MNNVVESKDLETECGLGRTGEINVSTACEKMILSYNTKMFRNEEKIEKRISCVLNGRV